MQLSQLIQLARFQMAVKEVKQMNKAFKSLKLTNKHQSNSFRSLIKYFDMMTFDDLADKYNKQQ